MASYPDGSPIKAGDRVRLNGWAGRILFVLDELQFAPDCPEFDWESLREKGILFGFEREDGELFTQRARESLVKLTD